MIEDDKEALSTLNGKCVHLKENMELHDDGFAITIQKNCEDGFGTYELCETHQESAKDLLLYLWNNAERLLSA